MAATKKDSYEPTVNNNSGMYSVYAKAQTFLTTSAYKVTSVKVNLYKSGSPNDLDVYIVPCTGSTPQGIANAIASGSFAAADISTDTAGTLYEITLGAGADLADATLYGIALRQNAASPNIITCRMRYSDNLYTDGSIWESNNDGETFTGIGEHTDRDWYFEVWGESPADEEEANAIFFGANFYFDPVN